ncbi:MAG: hypothetical protein M3315_07360 [Actinomycetota bacterium]|jgi:hypothetical protein|nr:hypothetical protein [Actinomycetota bacterium]HZB82546.1 hypothetical protein [Rubrobacteraceae bacterium]
MGDETRHAALQGSYGGEVLGWVRPRRLSEEEEAAIRRLIWQRFENVDEYLAYIDQQIRELVERNALDADVLNAIWDARASVMKFRPEG